MTATSHQIPANDANTRHLWLAIGALGATMLAMGGTLIYLQARPHESRMAPGPAMVAMQPEAMPAAAAAVAAQAAAQSATHSAVLKQDESEKPVATPAKKAPVAPRPAAAKNDKVAASTPAVAPPNRGAGSNAPVVATESAAPPVRPVCRQCGTVESAVPIQREGAGTGLGAVAGGVLGAVVGNQVGGGNGRTAATVLGALGGGWAGNSVEKKMKKDTLYQVRVRMEDGGSRTFELATPVGAGSRVTVEGGALRLADGSLASPLPPRPQRQTQSSPNPVQVGG